MSTREYVCMCVSVFVSVFVSSCPSTTTYSSFNWFTFPCIIHNTKKKYISQQDWKIVWVSHRAFSSLSFSKEDTMGWTSGWKKWHQKWIVKESPSKKKTWNVWTKKSLCRIHKSTSTYKLYLKIIFFDGKKTLWSSWIFSLSQYISREPWHKRGLHVRLCVCVSIEKVFKTSNLLTLWEKMHLCDH